MKLKDRNTLKIPSLIFSNKMIPKATRPGQTYNGLRPAKAKRNHNRSVIPLSIWGTSPQLNKKWLKTITTSKAHRKKPTLCWKSSGVFQFLKKWKKIRVTLSNVFVSMTDSYMTHIPKVLKIRFICFRINACFSMKKRPGKDWGEGPSKRGTSSRPLNTSGETSKWGLENAWYLFWGKTAGPTALSTWWRLCSLSRGEDIAASGTSTYLGCSSSSPSCWKSSRRTTSMG